MRPLQINQVDFAKLRSGKNYRHLNCHIMEFLYEDGEKLTFVAKRLKIHPFGMRSNVLNSADPSSNDWRTKKQLTLTFDQPSHDSEEYSFLSRLEDRLMQLIKENSDMVKAITGPTTNRSRRDQADPFMRLMAVPRLVKTPDQSGGQSNSRLLQVPFFKVNLPMLLNRNTGQPDDRFKFTIRDGITGSILEDFKPSVGNEQMVGNDRLSAVLQLDRVVAYRDGLSIQLALFQGKLYPRDRLHELPPQHIFHGPEPGRFPVIDLLADDDEADVVVVDDTGNTGNTDDGRGEPVMEGPSTCPVCLTASLTTVLNCGHAFCRACAEIITVCGVCRAAIVERRPLYLV